MFEEEEEEDRLLIDDNEEAEKAKLSPTGRRMSMTVQDFEANKTPPREINGLNSCREEGELDDDEVETTPATPVPVKKVEVVVQVVSDRKRANGGTELKPSPSESEVHAKKAKLSKSEKPEKRDQGTSVRSEAAQVDTEEPIFEMEAGSSFPLQLTVVCRLEGTNTLYFSAKWKDRELSGLLTDGEPPGFANFAKKRNTINSNSASESEKASVSTPKKRVRGQESKKKAKDDEEDDLDVTGLGDTRDSTGSGNMKLVEYNSESLHYCPFDGCKHAYPLSTEMEYHIATVHTKKAVMYENICTQTQTDGISKKMVSVQTDTEGLEVKAQVKEEVNEVEENPSPGSHFSDISDDVAPVLLKETALNGIAANPSTSSTGEPPGVNKSSLAVPKPQTPVQPVAAARPISASPRATNGLLVPAPNFVSPFSAPTNSAMATPSREHKNSTASASGEAIRPVASSPAQQRPQSYNHMMVQGAGPSQLQAAQMQQAAAMMQQMQLMQMMQQGRAGPFGMPMPTAHELQALQAQGAAMQALQAQGFMFSQPKH